VRLYGLLAIFGFINWHRLWEEDIGSKPYYRFPDEKLHGTYSLDGTTNNNQGDEPRTTALERQVQTLATTVECFTKQNHNLKEQLHQKNATLNTQEEDQEGTNTKRRN